MKRKIGCQRKECEEQISNEIYISPGVNTRLSMHLEYQEEIKTVLESMGGTYTPTLWKRKNIELAERFDTRESATFEIGCYEKRTITFVGEKVYLKISHLYEENNIIVSVLMPETKTQFLTGLRALRLEMWRKKYYNRDICDGIQWSLTIDFGDRKNGYMVWL